MSFLNIIQWTCRFINDFIMLYIDYCHNLLLRSGKTCFWCSTTCSNYSDYVTWTWFGIKIFTFSLLYFQHVFKALALVFIFLIQLRFPKNLSLIQIIHKRYGNTVVKLILRFEKLDFKHRKVALVLQFLKTCQEFKVSPKFLQFRVANDSLR